MGILKGVMGMDKKKIIIFGSTSLVLLLVIGISYAYWTKTFFQTESNIVDSSCFKIEFTDRNAIQLEQTFPVLDDEGLQNIPYTFTIQNVCNTSARYQINLESLEVSGKKLPDQYLKANLKEGNVQKITTKLDKELNPKLNTDPTIEGAISAYKLYEGILNPNETKEYNLRIWMHENVTSEMEDSMDASYQGKVSVIASYYQDNRGILKPTTTYQGIPELVPYKSNITKVVMEDKMNPKETEIILDLSSSQDGSVMGYIVTNEDNETYTLYMQSEGGIKANPNSSCLFYHFSKLESIEGLEYFDTNQVITMYSMFDGCSSLTSLDLSNFDTSHVTNMKRIFYDCSSLTNIDVSHFDTSKVTNMSQMFLNCFSLTNLDLSNFDTRNVIDMYRMFDECSSLINLNVSSFNTSKVTNMSQMFQNCFSLTNLDLSNFDTSNVIDMSQIFECCQSLTNLDVSSFDTSNVINMRSMFYDCSSLTNLDVSSFDTSKVTNMYQMFTSCSSLSNLNVSHFDTSNVTDMSEMFDGCEKLISLDISSFDTGNVTDMRAMFSGCYSLTNLDISHFNTSQVTDMSFMFTFCTNLTNIVYGENFVYKEGAAIRDMFDSCPANHPTHESWNGVQF